MKNKTRASYKNLKVFQDRSENKRNDQIEIGNKRIDELYERSSNSTQTVTTKIGFPNILVNGNFQVNQRGKTTYTSSGSSVVYTADRWCFSKMAGTTCVVGKNKVTLSATGTSRNDFFMQYVANPSFYSGRTLTLSVTYQNLNGKFGLGMWDGSSFAQTSWTSATSGTITLTKKIQASCTSLSCEFLKDTSTTISIEILSAKLEIGSEATPFYQRTYDEEFELCKPYFLRLKANSNYTAFATGITCSSSKAIVFVPQRMRTTPSISYSGSIKILNSSSYLTVSSISVDSRGSFGLALACAGSSFSTGQAAILSSQNDSSAYIDLDAEWR